MYRLCSFIAFIAPCARITDLKRKTLGQSGKNGAEDVERSVEGEVTDSSKPNCARCALDNALHFAVAFAIFLARRFVFSHRSSMI